MQVWPAYNLCLYDCGSCAHASFVVQLWGEEIAYAAEMVILHGEINNLL